MNGLHPIELDGCGECMQEADRHAFTRIPFKAKLFGRETYFREGFADAVEVLGDRANSILREAAILVIKPDGLAAGKVAPVAAFVQANGFEIRAAEMVVFTRFHWRELWRYQLTCATLDRLALNDIVLRGEALLLLLWRKQEESGIPASVSLSSLKGVSDVSRQSPTCLRRLLLQPNRVLSFIHVADEPADVLRELVILLEAPARHRVLAALVQPGMRAADCDLLRQHIACSAHPETTFDIQLALQRVLKSVKNATNGGSAAPLARESILTDLKRMKRGERVCWREFAKSLETCRIPLQRWDMAVLGAAFITYDEPGTSKLIQAVDPALWANASIKKTGG